MWTDGNGLFYFGDMQPGDRAATSEERAVYDFARAKADRRNAAAAAFDVALAAGVAYGGKVLQIGDDDRANITGQSSRAIASMLSGSGVTWPSDFAWRMADNSSLALPTAADMLALGQAAADRYAALRLSLGAIKDAIDAAADQAALDAIDVTAGWD
jgi:hypothetical protein